MHAFPTLGRSSARSKAGATFRVPSGDFPEQLDLFPASARQVRTQTAARVGVSGGFTRGHLHLACSSERQGYSRLPDDLRRCLCASLGAHVPPRVFSRTPFPV
ncbi:MAG: hypothetical protein DI599_08940 [Pseudomonas kuykendallii]|uniref:Uncharacterized protein n=1 Tax=Pseudomonas kuykendallii TaxID=1007099 RepID=A0A2W5D336_9PSED|nr:MAG: hypothetical protein DI599_08940 [Pseudomonas kuykendallii]